MLQPKSQSTGTRLRPAAYKTFVPDQFQQQNQRGSDYRPTFFDYKKFDVSKESDGKLMIRTLDFVRETLFALLNANV